MDLNISVYIQTSDSHSLKIAALYQQHETQMRSSLNFYPAHWKKSYLSIYYVFIYDSHLVPLPEELLHDAVHPESIDA